MPDHTAEHQPELLTITEAAELLRAPVATLRFWRHRNIGPRSSDSVRRRRYAWTPSTSSNGRSV
jgi:hypothetical protein